MGRSSIRIGSGAGFSGDRIDPAVALAKSGKLDYLVFECLAERTIARAVQSRHDDPNGGYDPLLEERLSAVLPAIVRKMGLGHPKIAADTGDDVLSQISADRCIHWENVS